MNISENHHSRSNRKLLAATCLVLSITGCKTIEQISSQPGGGPIKIQIGSTTPAGSTGTPSNAGNPTEVGTQNLELYRPHETSKTSFKGLFAKDESRDAYAGKLKWPRVAITFLKYGKTLPCWTISATIWKSQSSSSKEKFEICDVPVIVKDAMGKEAQISEVFAGDYATGMRALQIYQSLLPDTTGENRTDGPRPPTFPWKVQILGDNEAKYDARGKRMASFRDRMNAIMFRLAWVSGMARESDSGPLGSRTRLKDDWRMWFVKFDGSGNVDPK